MGGTTHHRLGIVLLAVGLAAAPARADKSGVSPNKVKLPSGPGSLGGIGENAEPNINMGLANYGVPIAVPAGRSAGVTPSLRLAYSSGAGQSVAGLGWSVGTPTVERMTSKGLPRYDPTDRFTAGGELVNIPGTNIYRKRMEGSFSRYTWVDPGGQGRAGYWRGENADGGVLYFGATSGGVAVPEALEQGPDGVFRYHLVETVDVSGHSLRYAYVKDGETSLLSRITYVFGAGGAPHYEINLTYESRQDELSDGKPGFELRLTQRLAGIQIVAGGLQSSRYALSYEPYGDTRGQTRLAGVETYGRNDAGPYPVRFSFFYTGSPLARCIGADCRLPYVETLGSTGVSFQTGDADLIDINGDALPDVVHTTSTGHAFFLNEKTSVSHALVGPIDSSPPFGVSARLSSAQVNMLDVDGDGFSDMIDGANDRILWNRGTGDWAAQGTLPTNLPDLAADADLRFFDYDNDRQTDLIHSDGMNTWYVLNQGDGTYATVATIGDPIQAGFTSDNLRLADMNGDGLQDAVLYFDGSGLMSYRMNLGRGRWSSWIDMFGLPLSLPPDFANIDFNGDGLSDVVVVQETEVQYALNRNGTEFEPMAAIDTTMLERGAIPSRIGAAIRYADMNGNGSVDVVWINPSGRVDYLELFPMRPNLLNQITNGIGKVIEIAYGSSVDHMARDGGPSAWTDRLPHPMLTLERLDHYDTLSGARNTQSFQYHDGYYDGAEKMFRGFGHVEVFSPGDVITEDGRRAHFFDLGQADPYYAGRQTRVITESGGRVLREEQFTFGECDVDGVPVTDPEIRFVCATATTTVVKEGKAASEWVTKESETQWDGHGNAILTINHGITAMGGVGCVPCARSPDVTGAPCGQQCLGDELYRETDYVPPTATGGLWNLRAGYRTRTYAQADRSVFTETATHYDGPDYLGLPLGQLTRGLATRKRVRRTAGEPLVDVWRARRDIHGNDVETRDALGNRRLYEYDADGFRAMAEEVVFDRVTSPAYSLRLEVGRDPAFGDVLSSSDWMVIEGGMPVTPPRTTQYVFDDFGRLSATLLPGDTVSAPTQEYSYELSDPTSRIIQRSRSVSGGIPDLETVLCFDGMGRNYQTRTRSGPAQFDVDGYTLYSSQGGDARVYQSHRSTSDACDAMEPVGVPFAQSRFDYLGRVLELSKPDDALYGTRSAVLTDFGPSYSVVHDEYDLDLTSPYAGTPTRAWFDGLGRKTSEERLPAAGESPAVTRYEFDRLGRPGAMIDTGGHTRRQLYDLGGYVVRREDPDMGILLEVRDDAGQLTTLTDARGEVTHTEYDEAGRMTARWSASDPAGSRVELTYDRDAACTDPMCANAAGRLVHATYPLDDGTNGTDRYFYDPRGQLVRLVREIGGASFAFETDYDNAGRAVARRYPDGRELRYVLDAQGRLLAIPGVISSVAYNGARSVDEVLLANGVRTAYAYDAVHRLAGISVTDGVGIPLISHGYQRDRWGNVTQLSDALASPSEPSANATFTYDAFERLTGAILDSGNGYEEILSFGYDLEDNLVSKTSSWGVTSKEHVGTYRYEAVGHAHAASRAGDTTLDYDPSGNVTRRGTETFAWNAHNQLARTSRGGQELARYAYDGAGERVLKREGVHVSYYLSPEFELRDGIATTYVLLDGRKVARLESATLAADLLSDVAPGSLSASAYIAEPDAAITAADAWVAARLSAGDLVAPAPLNPSDSAQLLAASARRLLGEPGSAAANVPAEYFHHDQRGSAIATTDGTGTLLQRTEYYPFGSNRYLSAGYEESYGFEGKEKDASTGVHFMAPRYKDLQLALWLSPDWSFFSVDPSGPPQPTVYGEQGQNPVSQRAWVGARPQNLGRAVEPVAQAAVSAGAAPPPQKRRPLAVAAAGMPSVQSFRAAPMTAHMAETLRTAPAGLQLFTGPMAAPAAPRPPPPPAHKTKEEPETECDFCQVLDFPTPRAPPDEPDLPDDEPCFEFCQPAAPPMPAPPPPRVVPSTRTSEHTFTGELASWTLANKSSTEWKLGASVVGALTQGVRYMQAGGDGKLVVTIVGSKLSSENYVKTQFSVDRERLMAVRAWLADKGLNPDDAEINIITDNDQRGDVPLVSVTARTSFTQGYVVPR